MPIGEVLFRTVVIPVQVQDKISHLDSILLFDDCVGERLTLKVTLRYFSLFFINYFRNFLWKNGSLGNLEYREFVAFLLADQGCYRMFPFLKRYVFLW